jgi:hypothetical protein
VLVGGLCQSGAGSRQHLAYVIRDQDVPHLVGVHVRRSTEPYPWPGFGPAQEQSSGRRRESPTQALPSATGDRRFEPLLDTSTALVTRFIAASIAGLNGEPRWNAASKRGIRTVAEGIAGGCLPGRHGQYSAGQRASLYCFRRSRGRTPGLPGRAYRHRPLRDARTVGSRVRAAIG